MASLVKASFLNITLNRKQLVSFLLDEKLIDTQTANGQRITLIIPGKVHERTKLSQTETSHTFQAWIKYRNKKKWYNVQLTSKDGKVFTGQAS
jgi:uncharacterized ubiquitin-like protein YukD